MNERWSKLLKTSIAIVFLLIAIVGYCKILYDSWNSDLFTKLQSGTIIYLGLLSLVIFYMNFKDKLSKLVDDHHLECFMKIFIIVAMILFLANLLWTEFLYWISGKGVYLPVIFSIALSLGLFVATQIINQAYDQKFSQGITK